RGHETNPPQRSRKHSQAAADSYRRIQLEPDDAQTLRRGQTSLFAGAARHVRRCTRPLDALDSLMEDGSTPTATLLLGTRRLTPLLQVNVQLAESRFCHGLLA